MSRERKSAGQKQVRLRLRVMSGKDIALGPGKIELLERLRATGSIAAAAEQMDMSYMRAWTLIRTMNRCFKKPLVAAVRGGARGGGGAALTETGREVLMLYQRTNTQCLQTARPGWQQLKKLLR
jgi:molybdate transport system regulatory protein